MLRTNSRLLSRRGIHTWSEESSHEINAYNNRSNGRRLSAVGQAPSVLFDWSNQPRGEKQLSRGAAVLQSLCGQAKQHLLWRRLLLLRWVPQVRVTLLARYAESCVTAARWSVRRVGVAPLGEPDGAWPGLKLLAQVNRRRGYRVPLQRARSSGRVNLKIVRYAATPKTPP
jgi:hypothetical protein